MNNDGPLLAPRSVKIPEHKRVSNQDGTLSFRDLNQSSFLPSSSARYCRSNKRD
jgi:hypothetical protein